MDRLVRHLIRGPLAAVAIATAGMISTSASSQPPGKSTAQITTLDNIVQALTALGYSPKLIGNSVYVTDARNYQYSFQLTETHHMFATVTLPSIPAKLLTKGPYMDALRSNNEGSLYFALDKSDDGSYRFIVTSYTDTVGVPADFIRNKLSGLQAFCDKNRGIWDSSAWKK